MCPGATRHPSRESHRVFVERSDRATGSAETRHLAWMLLYDASGSETLANDWCDSFAEEVVERFPQDGFVLGRDEITAWLESSP